MKSSDWRGILIYSAEQGLRGSHLYYIASLTIIHQLNGDRVLKKFYFNSASPVLTLKLG